MAEMKQLCKTCRFWHPLGAQLVGECRRYPPNLSVLSNIEHLKTHPKTDANISCGEWKKKP